MKKAFSSFLISFALVFIAYSLSVVAIDVSQSTGLSGAIGSSYVSYSVNFGDTYSSIGGACFDFTFTGNLLDANETLYYSLVPAPASYSYGFSHTGSTSLSTRTSCLTPAHQTFNELLDGSVTGSVWMQSGNVTVQSLVIRLTNAVSNATTTTTLPPTTTTIATTTTTTLPNATTTTVPSVTTTTTIPNVTTTTVPSAGSCQGYCNKKSPAGCWCDAACVSSGDCCPDYKSVCAVQSNVTTTTIPSIITPTESMQITITLPKTTYYPNENLEPKVTITDASGKLISDATIKSTIIGPKTYYPYFFYSTLCDCYKSSYWLSESTLIGDYTLSLEASHPNFLKTTSSAAFKVAKPTISTFTIATDKGEYSPGDTVTITIKATDSFGNAIKDLYITGEARDATTGRLISAVYPYLSGDVYTYTYYPSSEDLGKSFKIVVSTKWKEQTSSAETTFSIVRRGLTADVVLENNVLSPKDSLKGRIKVLDKDGKAVTDAYVSINVIDQQGNYAKYLDTVYRDGFYEIKEWKVEDWVSVGTYTLEIKVSKHPEEIILEKQIEITKDKLNVEVILDKTSYRPGDQVFMKILVTYPDGTVAKDAWISAEIFPLVEQPFGREETGFYQLSVCRIYPSPIPPVYYKGQFIQKYFIDNPYIHSDCPIGKYALVLKVSATGYSDSEITKEFDVALAKLFIETGFSVDSQADSVNLAIYADVKDESGKAVEYATIEGVLRTPEEIKGCIKRFSLYYDNILRRYVGNEFVSRYECPADNYIIQLRASSTSYETAEVVQGLTIQYKQGYEYRAYVPATPTESACREVSCGSNCIEKICESAMPAEECFNIVVDDECISACTEDLEKIEREVRAGGATIKEGDFEDCINKCTNKLACQGSGIPVIPLEVMVQKLSELRKEVAETKEEVSGLKQIVLAIIDFVNSILQKYLGQQQAITVPSEAIENVTTNETNPVTGAVAALIRSVSR